MHPLGDHASWSPGIVESGPLDGRSDRARQAYAYPDRHGRPIVRVLSLDTQQSIDGREVATSVIEDSALHRSYWAHFSERRRVRVHPDGALLEVEITDHYRGVAMFLFRYFAARRELAQLAQWAETGVARAGGIIEHPLTQVLSATLSTLVMWPFFGLTANGLLLSTLLTVVIVLHEFGHIAAYRTFGHRSARMIFIPFLGGLAIGGRPYNSLFEVAACALMGPGLSAFLVPVTIAAFELAHGGSLPHELAGPAILFLLVLGAFNLLNLLPMYRFDGGQVIRQVFPSRPVQIAASFGVTAVILGVGWRIGLPTVAIMAALAVFTLLSLMSVGRVKPREALDPMTGGERLVAGFGLYAALAIHAYAVVYACEKLFPWLAG
ncbi:hypothetical protein [Gellertiella hungarica]|uniref:Zn-dependent protease n=1 Tax=Gellertiella hungarica TaxID=1572859 RepID=A0A7W6NJY6_9HYPH|nr:hypothetical protein [Gellertiella hungarica]MBB4064895.1 Zn-dependent protease [Gellertiella hungarica]